MKSWEKIIQERIRRFRWTQEAQQRQPVLAVMTFYGIVTARNPQELAQKLAALRQS